MQHSHDQIPAGVRRDWTGTRNARRDWTRTRGAHLDWRNDTGAATAEYAITIMAAVGFAGLLVVILRSEEVRTILTDLVRSALSIAG
jgi:hypothetical protein